MALVIAEEPVRASGPRSLGFAALDELERRYGQVGDRSHFVVDEFAPPLGAFLVARLDGHLAGGVGIRPIGDAAARSGEVTRLWVRPDLRRGGVAVALMESIVVRARSLGYAQLYLETGRAQPEARSLYEKLGWRPVDAFADGAHNHPEAFLFAFAL